MYHTTLKTVWTCGLLGLLTFLTAACSSSSPPASISTLAPSPTPVISRSPPPGSKSTVQPAPTAKPVPTGELTTERVVTVPTTTLMLVTPDPEVEARQESIFLELLGAFPDTAQPPAVSISDYARAREAFGIPLPEPDADTDRLIQYLRGMQQPNTRGILGRSLVVSARGQNYENS